MLRSSYLPVVIELRDRKDYIDLDLLARYELAIGPVTAETGVWPAEVQQAPFLAFCQQSYPAAGAVGSASTTGMRGASSRQEIDGCYSHSQILAFRCKMKKA